MRPWYICYQAVIVKLIANSQLRMGEFRNNTTRMVAGADNL